MKLRRNNDINSSKDHELYASVKIHENDGKQDYTREKWNYIIWVVHPQRLYRRFGVFHVRLKRMQLLDILRNNRIMNSWWLCQRIILFTYASESWSLKWTTWVFISIVIVMGKAYFHLFFTVHKHLATSEGVLNFSCVVQMLHSFVAYGKSMLVMIYSSTSSPSFMLFCNFFLVRIICFSSECLSWHQDFMTYGKVETRKVEMAIHYIVNIYSTLLHK